MNDLTPHGELVSLAIGKGREIGNVVTVAYTQFYSTFGEIIANGSSYNAKPGAIIDIPLGYQKSCTIRVLEISDSVVNSRISCEGI